VYVCVCVCVHVCVCVKHLGLWQERVSDKLREGFWQVQRGSLTSSERVSDKRGSLTREGLWQERVSDKRVSDKRVLPSDKRALSEFACKQTRKHGEKPVPCFVCFFVLYGFWAKRDLQKNKKNLDVLCRFLVPCFVGLFFVGLLFTQEISKETYKQHLGFGWEREKSPTKKSP